MDESTLGVHEIELVTESAPGLGDSGGVAQHAHGTVDLGEIAVGDQLWWLVADTDLETSWAPVDELDGPLGLDVGDSSVHVLCDDVSTVQQTGGHVLSVPWVALNHLVGGLEAGSGNLVDAVGLVLCLGGGDNRRVGDEREVDTRIRDKVGLELVEIDVEGAVESERSSDGRNDLSDQSVKVLKVRSLDTQTLSADVVDGLVVDHEAAVGVFEGGVGGQDGVVWLNDRRSVLRSRVNREFELALLSVVNGKTLHEQGAETGTGTSTEGVEDQETLETIAVIGNPANSVENCVDELLSDGVVATSIVVASIFLSGDHLFWVEQGSVGTSANFVDDIWLEVDVDSPWDVLSGAGLSEESTESVITRTFFLCGSQVTIRLDTVLQTVKLPAGVGDLATSLTDVDRNNFTHDELYFVKKKTKTVVTKGTLFEGI